MRLPPTSTLFPYTTLFRSLVSLVSGRGRDVVVGEAGRQSSVGMHLLEQELRLLLDGLDGVLAGDPAQRRRLTGRKLDQDRKSTRSNSSHPNISYAVFCLKK